MQLLSEILAVFAIQSTLCVFLVMHAHKQISDCPVPVNFEIAFTRFMSGLIMLMKMSEEIREGMDKMKYSLNHYWKFSWPGGAWLAGSIQVFMSMLVVVLNYYIILSNDDVIEIVMNFLALTVISECDD